MVTNLRPTPDRPAGAAPARALLRWQRGAGPFWPYVGATPFISPYLCGDGETAVPAAARQSAAQAPAPRLPRGLRSAAAPPTAWFTDLPAAPLLAAAGELAALGFWVAPLVQRWLVDGGVLPPEPLAAALLAPPQGYGNPHAQRPRGVVFILDGERCGRRRPLGQPYRPRRFDNRYEYTLHVFPPPAVLEAQGIRRVGWVAGRHGAAVDLALYLRSAAAAGLVVEPTPPPVSGRADL